MKLRRNKNRPLSWSAISSFEWDPEQWYRRYILNIQEPPSKEMEFGKVFAKSCEDRKPLAPVTLLNKMEHKFEIVFDGIPLVGYADTFCTDTKKKIGEYKTSKKPWTQEKVDGHGQLTMYALMNFVTNKIKPEELEIFLENVQTHEGGDFTLDFIQPIKVHHFKTKRSMKDVLKFASRIKDTVRQMDEYCEQHE